MISTLLSPTKGDALVMGHSVTKEPMAVKKVHRRCPPGDRPV